MNIRFRPGVMVLCAAVVLAAIYISCLKRIAQRQAHASGRYGPITADQILDRTTALTYRLCPQDRGLQLSVDPTEVYNPQGARVNVWHVTCMNSKGQETAYFTWDAGTGRLLGFSDLHDNVGVRPEGGMNGSEAAGAAQDWMRQLNGEAARSDWRLAGTPQQNAKSWIVALVAASGRAVLEIDKQSGRPLIYRLRST